jgi:ribosomal-protein-alanine N-acetyltransferase
MYEDELSRLGQSRWYQVLESNSQIIGYIGVAYVGEDADIQTIAITTESQRKGYGEQLIITALNFLSKHGIKKVFLEVEVNNSPAISMYQKLGFQNLTIRLNYYGPGKNAQTMVLDLKDDADE